MVPPQETIQPCVEIFCVELFMFTNCCLLLTCCCCCCWSWQEPPGQVWCDCVTMQASWMWTWQTVAAKNAEQVAVCSNIFPSKSFLHSGVFEWLEEETRVSNPHLKYHHSYSRNIANNSRLVNPLVKQKLRLWGDY